MSTAEASPGSGFIGCDNTTVRNATVFFASVYDESGSVVRFDQLEVDSLFTIYEISQLHTWDTYRVTGTIELMETDTWFRIPVAFEESGPLDFTPGNNKPVEVRG